MNGGDQDHGDVTPDDFSGNEFRGTVYGPAVQARDIHGGMHIHKPAESVPKPRQLPAVAALVDRETDLVALDDARAQGSGLAPVAVVSGPAGIGKSALVLNWAHRTRTDYPDGQLFADLRGHAPGDPANPAHILGAFLRALGTPPQRIPAELSEMAALYRSATADRRLLVILDDAISAAQVSPLLPATAGSLAIVTSRWRLAGLMARGARTIALDRLDEDAAVRLVTLAIGTDRATAEPEATRRLVGLCARFPLALSVAAARLAVRPGWQVAEMADALAQERIRLSVLSTEVDDLAVRGAIDLSYGALPPDAARMYRLLGLFPGTSFESGMAASLAGASTVQARRLLDLLTDANLLRETSAGRYRFHDLIRLHAGERAESDEPEPAREEAVRRMLDWYLAAAAAAARTATPYWPDRHRNAGHAAEPVEFAGPDEGLAWLERELPDLLALVRHAKRHGHFAFAWRLVDVTWPLFLQRGLYAQRLEFDDHGLEAARAAGDPEAEATMLDRVGHALRDQDRTEEATEHFTAASVIWRDLGDTHRVVESLARLGIIARDQERLPEAISNFQEALRLCRSMPSPPPRTESLMHGDLGVVLTRAGRPQEAIGHLEAARELMAGVPDPYNQARILVRLAQAHLADDATARAETLFTEALSMMRRIGSSPGEAEALEGLGEVAAALGRPEEAQRRFVEALDILTGIGSPKAARLRGRTGRPSSGP